jgi:hypothetical protein
MKGADDPVANLNSGYALADGRDLAGAVRERHDTELRRTATASFDDHQISVIERAPAHAHRDIFRPWLGILARSPDDPVDAAEVVELVRFHPLLLDRIFTCC